MKFVLVHGSGHHGSMWKQVREHLEAQGHEVHTPTIGGFEHGCMKGDFQTLDLAAAPVISYIVDHDLSDYVLLGHSFGGMIITKVALKLNGTKNEPNRIIYQNAFVPADGQSIADMMPTPVGTKETLTDTSLAQETVEILFFAFRNFLIQLADDKLAQEVFETLIPQPSGQLIDKISVKGFDKLNFPKTFMMADEDISLGAADKWKVMLPKLQGPYNLIEIIGDHEIMFTNPKLLAEKIIEAGNGGGKLYAAGTSP